ncbi:MAG: hypothetical protein KatS3mg126_2252 [Lysobacteraceae bacterium]|nr:MAG: hypothetical protein KatS3mg126_2252 [Xanthomonadaceae bacterium]
MSRPEPRPATRRAIGPRLRWVLRGSLVLVAVLAIDALYLAGVRLLEWQTGNAYQDYGYQLMFLLHLVAGVLLVPPALAFIVLHARNTLARPNRRAVRAGIGLASMAVLVLASGLVLVRIDGFALNHPTGREVAYWIHAVTPLLCLWLFLLHRLVGPRLRWRGGLAIAGIALLAVTPLFWLQRSGPATMDRGQPPADFTPSLVRTAGGGRIPAAELMRDDYCASCHRDAQERWLHSAHRMASFSNPVYRFAVRNTRRAMLERDGNVHGARFCAGCHDLVPLLSGAFDDPQFDDVGDPSAAAGINCLGCHAITRVNSPRGNADFTIERPVHYPFAFSTSPMLAWLSRQLIKANPDFHRRTFLKPLHREPEFCGSCHKVHLPETLNAYKWLRGQNHYDGFLLSGVSGHGVSSFYYPPRAVPGCSTCHMPLRPSEDFAARDFDGSGTRSVHDHLFPAANTGVPALLGTLEHVLADHQAMLGKALRVDLVALREGGRIDGRLLGPLRPERPVLAAGRSYLVEVVVRTLGMGHPFTEGTADSNEVWVELEAWLDGERLGHSGQLDPATGEVDPHAHFIRAFVLDREGRRIDRRNPEDIFVPLYNHQIPPGAADLLHYRLTLPEDARGQLVVRARVHYRKFDTTLMRHVEGDAFAGNTLPVSLLAEDQVTLPVGGGAVPADADPSPPPEWERWNDYGIGALRKPARRQLRQAEEAFARVEALGRGDGALNLARVYLEEGRLDEAAEALRRAAEAQVPAPAWTRVWFGALVLRQEGRLAEAIEALTSLVETRFAEARQRGFDFSRDYRLLNELGQSWLERALGMRTPASDAQRQAALEQAQRWFEAALEQDPENAASHYGLVQVHRERGDAAAAARHAAEHARYRLDENARDRAVAAARQRYPEARAAADPVAIYDLQRPGREAYDRPPRPVTARAPSP